MEGRSSESILAKRKSSSCKIWNKRKIKMAEKDMLDLFVWWALGMS